MGNGKMENGIKEGEMIPGERENESLIFQSFHRLKPDLLEVVFVPLLFEE